MRDMSKEMKAMRNELKARSEAEATKLYRLAWRAKEHGCSNETVAKIRAEASELHMNAYPERILAWDFEYKHEFAFKY